ncbi:PD-(D/E)XK nuclease-like domain-containing protein [Salmonella enterica subsp. enterica serovar Newport]|nr:exonuclease VIII [Salmonella enterica]EBW3412610.1 exonuclease VIII [Salmonella enterica subsp. enterica serovar Newport]ECE6270492.1 exonuclease VIII [Salmonella enterica subsp. diarizonae]ECO1510221.1 exonuclease VIII [Salmonella enterica subsp. arizonae]ECH6754009.1 exonuclease VIII [Salmonella enterica subsp. enterica serovar Newport]
MSDKKEDFALYCPVKNEEARKRLGIKAGFFWVTVKKLSVAVSRCITAMDDKGYDEDDFKKPVRVNFPVVNDLPPEGVFDTEFCNRYEKGGDDGITMMQIPGAVPADQFHEKPVETPYTSTADNTDTEAGDNVTGDTAPLPAYAYNVNGELMSEVEKDMTQSVSGKSFAVRFRANWKQPQCVKDVATWQLQEINAELMDPTGYMADIELALSDKEIASRLDKLEMRDVHCYSRDIEKVFPENKRPGIQYVREFTKAWLDTDYIDRGLLVKEWQKGNRVSCIGKPEANDSPEPQKTSVTKADVAVSGVPATKTTYKAIDIRIGCALTKGEITYPITARVVEQGKAIVEADGEEFKRWSATYRITENIQFYDEKTHIEMIRQAPREVVTGSPELRRAYVDNYLSAYGTLDPDQMVFMPKRAPVEHAENLERVRKAGKNLRDMAAGRFKCEEKPQSEDVLADEPATAEAVEQGTTEHHPNPQPLDAQSSVESDKTSREQFSEQLAADRGDFVPGISDPDDPKWVRDDYSASNEGEKTEVAADDATDTADYVDHSEEFSSQPEPETSHSEPVADQNEPETPETEPEPQSHVPDDIQPGIYFGVTNEAYHAGPGVSKSQLDDIAVCPAFYQWRKSAPVDTEKTKALDMGTALHCRLLEPDEFKKRFIIAPEFNRRTTAGKEEEKAFLESCENSGKTVMTSEEGRKLELMYGSVMAHPGCRALLEAEGKTESSIYWTDTETGELCRIRPDKFLTNSPLILDVKKVADMSRFARHVEEFRYHVQAAMYCEGWKAYSGETPRFAFLAVSESIDCGKYPVHLYILEDEHHDIGYSLFRRDLNTYHKCKSSNKWGWGFEIIERPYWARG